MMGPGKGLYLVCLIKAREPVWLKWCKQGTDNQEMSQMVTEAGADYIWLVDLIRRNQ